MIKINITFFLLSLLPASLLAENISSDHPSPYVRLHVNDAVKWQRWDSSVLERARKENKLIMISSGYFACHWCHVMRKESFTDEAVANVLNNQFIPVKIDREENPSVDTYLMNFMQHTQGYGGWPLNVFITPQGYPLTGLVYLPKEKFIEIAAGLNKKWIKDRANFEGIARRAFEYTEKLNKSIVSISDEELVNNLMLAVAENADELEGGFGQQLKFPKPHLIMSLLNIYEVKKDIVSMEFLELTLEQMLNKGLHDAIGGGFFRYTVDQSWNTPHFEKMLYTNAAMIKLYVKAYQLFGDKKWLQVAEETMEFVIREMDREEGGYVSTLNAQDAAEEEGGNYLWLQENLLKKLNAKEISWVEKNMEIKPVTETEKVLPLGFMYGEEARIIRKKWLSKRIENAPVKDDKLIVSWNAYLLSAMADLIRVSKKIEYVEAAQVQYQLLKNKAKSGLLRGANAHPQKYIEDYAFTASALWEWGQVSGVSSDEVLIRSLLTETVELFVTEHGWRESDEPILPMPGEQRNIKDGNLPSAEVEVLKMFRQLKQNKLKSREKLNAVMDGVDQRIVVNPEEYASYISARYRGELLEGGLKP